jgi:hypothetical protein
MGHPRVGACGEPAACSLPRDAGGRCCRCRCRCRHLYVLVLQGESALNTTSPATQLQRTSSTTTNGSTGSEDSWAGLVAQRQQRQQRQLHEVGLGQSASGQGCSLVSWPAGNKADPPGMQSPATQLEGQGGAAGGMPDMASAPPLCATGGWEALQAATRDTATDEGWRVRRSMPDEQPPRRSFSLAGRRSSTSWKRAARTSDPALGAFSEGIGKDGEYGAPIGGGASDAPSTPSRAVKLHQEPGSRSGVRRGMMRTGTLLQSRFPFFGRSRSGKSPKRAAALLQVRSGQPRGQGG